jgi:predicted O-linked N-acetylglucosamine transferase (SPINDLY family)
MPWQPATGFLGVLKNADVYLDTIGFSGFNTALYAVEAGLPIVCRDGRFLRGRLASGILKRLGLPELVAPTEEAYVDLAVRLASDRAYRQSVRARMEKARSVLYEDAAPVRALEEFLLQARSPA